MPRRSIFKRIAATARRVLGIEPAPPELKPSAAEPPRQPPPPPPPAPPSFPEPEPEPEPGFFDEVPPEESGIPPGPVRSPWDELGRDMGIGEDEYAMNLLWFGWFADDISADQRMDARQTFFDYTGLDSYDFDWDQWREWYTSTAA